MFSSTTPDVLKSLQLPGAARCRCKKTRVNALAQLFVPMIVTAHDVVSCERRYFLTSLGCDAARFAQAVRQHWGIENSLHWVLDVSFREDDCRIRQDAGAQTMSVLRHIALNLIRRESSHKRGVKARRKRAVWDHSYLLQVLTG